MELLQFVPVGCTAAENGFSVPTKLLVVLVFRGASLPFLGSVKAVFRTRLVGGRAPGRVYRPAGAGEYFVNSSLSPVLLFRRRLSSVGDVLKGIRRHGFSTARWAAVCRHVASARRDAASLAWKRWLHEDLSSRPYQLLRPDLGLPAPYLVCDPKQTPGGCGILVQPGLIDAQFRKAWMPFFRRGERDPVTSSDFFGLHRWFLGSGGRH